MARRLQVRERHGGRLRRRLDHAHRVGHRIGDGRRAEAEQGVARERGRQGVVRGQLLVGRIVEAVPAVVAEEGLRERARNGLRVRLRERERVRERERDRNPSVYSLLVSLVGRMKEKKIKPDQRD